MMDAKTVRITIMVFKIIETIMDTKTILDPTKDPTIMDSQTTITKMDELPIITTITTMTRVGRTIMVEIDHIMEITTTEIGREMTIETIVKIVANKMDTTIETNRIRNISTTDLSAND